MSVASILQSIRTCDGPQFTDNWQQWFESLLSIIQRDPKNDKAWISLASLIQEAHVFPSISRQLATTKISPLCSDICKQSEPTRAQFYCLSNCLKLYPNSCSGQYAKMETFILNSLSSGESDVVEISCICFGLFSMVVPPGHSRTKQAERWMEILHSTINTILSCLVHFDPELQSDSTNILCFPQETVQNQNSICNRIEILFNCIRQLIVVAEIPGRTVPINDLVSLIQKSLIRNEQDQNFIFLIRMHLASLRLLADLYKSVGVQIMPFVKSIALWLCVDYEWQATITECDDKVQLKVIIFNCLEALAESYGLAANLHTTSERLWKAIQNELQLTTQNTTESFANTTINRKRRKNKNKDNLHQTSINQAADLFISKSPSINTIQSYSACCRFLKSLLLSVGSFMKVGFLSDCQRFICRTALAAVQHADNRSTSLLDVLRTTLIINCPSIPPPVQIASQIFTIGRTSECQLTRQISIEGSALCLSISRPHLPILESVPIDIPAQPVIPERSTDQTQHLTEATNGIEDDAVETAVEKPFIPDEPSKIREETVTRLVRIDSSTNSSSSDSEEDEVQILEPEFKKPRPIDPMKSTEILKEPSTTSAEVNEKDIEIGDVTENSEKGAVTDMLGDFVE